MSNWLAAGSVTLVGSMPHRDRHKTIELILDSTPELPVWPQLAGFPAEQMMVQYNEGLPGLPPEDYSTSLQTDAPGFEQDLYLFYEDYLHVEENREALDHSRFAMGPETGRTLSHFIDTLSGLSHPCKAVKGQIVGPFTLLSGLKDEQQRALLYDDRLREVVSKHLAMKAQWQIRRLESLDRPVLVFVDEPALAGFGSSSFISVSAEMVRGLLEEVFEGIHRAGARAGVHICANTDWSLVLNSSVDVVNFDSFNYFDKFKLYKEELLHFVERGGIVAWGVVPTNDHRLLRTETARSLADRWLAEIDGLVTDTVSATTLLDHSLFTPSCGCGSLSEPDAERVLVLLHEFGDLVRSAF